MFCLKGIMLVDRCRRRNACGFDVVFEFLREGGKEFLILVCSIIFWLLYGYVLFFYEM